jgi:hypothetical protein
MKFDEAVTQIGTLTTLRRIAGAHVVDHRQLQDEELREAIQKVRPQFLHEETVIESLEAVLFKNVDNSIRVLSRLILRDVLLEQYGAELASSNTEESVIATEQEIVNQSNEMDLDDLAAGNKNSKRFEDLKLYQFVLNVAWLNEDSKSPDEVNLLRKLRQHLRITEEDHRLLESQLGKFPKPDNELHGRGEIHHARRLLQSQGLLFSIRRDDGIDIDVIPDELASIMRCCFQIELREESYRAIFKHRPLRRKNHLQEVLDKNGVEYSQYDTVDQLIERVMRYIPASLAIASNSPRYGLNSTQLSDWCKELGLPQSGSIEEKRTRLLEHYDQLRPLLEEHDDQRARWYEFFDQLAWRDYDTLRAQHVIDKDLDIESQFEEATRYLFAEKLNHAPLRQSGSNRPDGVLSLQNRYVMWDNKSREKPVNLKDHLAQFDDYINKSDKPVPIFMVIAPAFTEESQSDALRYRAQHFDRDIVLITAKELKDLAEEWSSSSNRGREEPFPLGLLAVNGRFDRSRLGKLF